MNKVLAIFLLLFSPWIMAQSDSVRFYSLDEVSNSNPDTIFAISLKKQKLTSLPEELFKFKSIKYLDLEKNEFDNINRLGEFKELVYLNLGRNKLQNFPVAICQMANLEILIVNRNDFNTVPPCINFCQKLKYIDFWETPVSSLPTEMTSIETLKEIDFSGVRMNRATQEKLISQFPTVKLHLDEPCHCLN
jgi:Leucine-rich repeat (LRR) protein